MFFWVFFSGNEHNVCLKSEIKNTNYYLYISLCLLPDANAFLSMGNGFPAKAPLEKERIQNWHYHGSSNLSTFSMTFILQDLSFDYIHKLKTKLILGELNTLWIISIKIKQNIQYFHLKVYIFPQKSQSTLKLQQLKLPSQGQHADSCLQSLHSLQVTLQHPTIATIERTSNHS